MDKADYEVVGPCCSPVEPLETKLVERTQSEFQRDFFNCRTETDRKKEMLKRLIECKQFSNPDEDLKEPYSELRSKYLD